MGGLTPEMIEAAAKAAHEANRAHCQAIGDDSQVPWDEAPEWQKESARKGVLFLIANPGAGDSAQHDSWMAAKVADGWVHGEVKDAEAKTHPCLVPFDQLPPEQQAKDRIFRETVLASLKTPPAQAGDKPDEVAKPVAQPVLQSVDAGKAELAENPARGSTLTEAGHLVRE